MSADPIAVRAYGADGPTVLVLHGGPGAPGSAAPLARALAERFRVLEPLQRRSSAAAAPLTVARHVADLAQVIEQRCTGEPPAVVGHSWGAMLALCHAAEHPASVRTLALVGCGSFDEVSREELQRRIVERATPELLRQLDALDRDCPDPDERLRAEGDLMLPFYSFLPTAERLEGERCDARGHRESWADMLRLQREGAVPARFARIAAPTLMLHGAHDPHPGAMIRDTLKAWIPQLEYREWAECGHYPWLEAKVAEDFVGFLAGWLESHGT